MAKGYVHHYPYFYGNKISPYGLENGYIDYATLAKSFNHVLANNIMKAGEYEDWQLVNGYDWDEENDRYIEVFQSYIIDGAGAEILQEMTDEIVWYNEELDLYVWGVTHWGTAWDYVLTDIPVVINKEEEF